LRIRRFRPEDWYDAYVGRIARGVGVSAARILFVRCQLGLWAYGRRYPRPLLPSFEDLPALPFPLGRDPSDRQFVASFLDVFRRRPAR
jgi:hypothetical protein